MITVPIVDPGPRYGDGLAIFAGSCAASSEKVLTIPITGDWTGTYTDWKGGTHSLRLPASVPLVSRRRMGMTGPITLAAKVDDQISMAMTLQSIVFSMCSWIFKALISMRYGADGALTKNEYQYSGGQIRIKHAVLDGSDIKITIENTHPSAVGNYSYEVQWHVWR